MSFQVLYALCNTGGWDGLHSGGTALVDDCGLIVTAVIRMGVVFSSSCKNIFTLGQELQHLLIWGKPESEDQAFIAVIRTHKILWLQMKGGSQLYGLMSSRSGVNILTGTPVGFIDVSHRFYLAHQPVSVQQN